MRSFSQRYDISKTLLSSLALPLTTIDGNNNLNQTAISLKDTIISQLNSINKKASSIIFYNEPLSNLQELKYPFLFSYDIFDPFTDIISNTTNKNTNNDDNVNENKKSIVDTAINDDITEENYSIRQSNDIIKLKMGLRLESRKWRSQADQAFGSLSSSTNNFILNQVIKLSQDLVDPFDGDSNSIQRRLLQHNSKASKSKWRLIMEQIDAAKNMNPHLLSYKKTKNDVIPNYALLIHSCLMMSMATYNLELKKSDVVNQALLMLNGVLVNENVETDLELEAIRRAEALAGNALGTSSFSEGLIDMRSIVSDKACALFIYEKSKKLAVLVFRGTKDPIDVITDLSFVSSPFTPMEDNSGPILKHQRMEVHVGFLNAFDSIKNEISEILETLPKDTKYLITGHSMGGALAQISAAYYSHLKPWLVSIAAPSVGNTAFCNFVNENVHPFGGIRLWNEYDAVPYIALLVGYCHAGIPIKMKLQSEARELFLAESINTVVASTDVISPHILYQIGQLVHVFPVMGTELGIKPEEIMGIKPEEIMGLKFDIKETQEVKILETNNPDIDIKDTIGKSYVQIISTSLTRLKYISRDYAYSIAFNLSDSNSNNYSNNKIVKIWKRIKDLFD